MRKNIVGLQKGVEVGFVTNRNFKSTYFYQATQKFSFGENVRNYPFHGLNLQFPIKQCDGIVFSGSLRTGIVNNRYFMVTPSVFYRAQDRRPHLNGYNRWVSGRAGCNGCEAFNQNINPMKALKLSIILILVAFTFSCEETIDSPIEYFHH